MPASVDSKPLTQTLSPLDATLTENQGEGRHPMDVHTGFDSYAAAVSFSWPAFIHPISPQMPNPTAFSAP